MALTQITTGGLLDSSVTNAKISPTVQLGGPTISQIQITDSSYTVLDDTAVNTAGGYIKITGTGFSAGAQVIINSTNASSVAFISSTTLNVQVPAMAAGTYVVYVVNTNGGVGIAVNGLTYSGVPTWVTGSTLPGGTSGVAISIQLSATGDAPLTYAVAAGSTLPTGLSLTSGGLLSGTVTVATQTVYSFTINAIDAQLQDSPRAFSITIVVADPYFYLTTLLLPGNGTNNGTNSTFLDGSTNNFTVTRYGNTTQGTFSPYSLTGFSNYFDGSVYTNYLSTTGSLAPFQFGTGDFTVEAWIYITGNSAPDPGNNRYAEIVGYSNSSVTDGGWLFQVSGDTTTTGTGLVFQHWYAGGSATTISVTTTISQYAWHHVAAVRSGTTTSLYLDGTRVQTGTLSDQNIVLGDTLGIAMRPWPNNYKFPFYGYISNLRIVKGTAVYTGASYAVPTAPLTAISGTSLLTCQSNRFKDNSSNAYALTVNGTPSVQSFSPFAPGASYSTSTVGGAGYFDGSGDYLDITDSSNLLDLGGAAKSVEAWFYPNGTATYVIFDKSGGTADWNASTGFEWQIQFVNGIFNFYYNSGTNPINLTDSVTRPAYQWYHIAVATNASNAISLYINGTRVATATNAITKPTNRTLVRLGQDVSGNYYNGYVSGLRFLSGANAIDPTQSTITVPSSPPTAISGTQLLYNFTNGQIIDATSKNDLETVGDAKISTAQYKWGGSSIYLDGTGDYLDIPSNMNFTFGTKDFTVEFWIKTNLTTFNFMNPVSATGSGYWGLLFQTGNFRWNDAYNVTNLIAVSATAILDNNWHHVAIARSAGTSKVFFDGVSQISQADTTNYSGTGAWRIGYGNVGYLNGYIQDLRITRGYARYTTNFTAPASAFQTL